VKPTDSAKMAQIGTPEIDNTLKRRGHKSGRKKSSTKAKEEPTTAKHDAGPKAAKKHQDQDVFGAGAQFWSQ
jgi:hypothetical protein